MVDNLAVTAALPADYERFGLSPNSIAEWEDGVRTDDSAGTYEWWYFDAHLADGAKLIKGVKRIAAKLAHFDGAYLRFFGAIEISRYRGAELIERHKDDAIWELAYFGHARDQ
ncbi:MAG: hypothetical protein JWM72_1329 [Actinomycetia bacterium]|jgi:hypothetical protein|nr:hypothetical protein [Actinomycetes bacterium]